MPAIQLTIAERKAHRADAHHLDPVVMIGNDGLTPAVKKEAEGAKKTDQMGWLLALPSAAPVVDRYALRSANEQTKETFEYAVMRGMSEIMAHTITLHLLDAPGRVHRFMRKHPNLVDRIPQKELASYLNLSAETLSRLRHRGKI